MSAARSASSAAAEQSVAQRPFATNSAANLPALRPAVPRYLLSFTRASASFSTKASAIFPSDAATSQKRIEASASSICAACSRTRRVVEEYPVVRDVAVERGFAEAAAFVDVHLEPFGADEIHQLARNFDALDGRRDGESDEAAPLSRGRHACEHAAAAVRRRAGLDEADDAFFLFLRQLRAGAELHDGDVYSAAAHERRVACDYFVRRDEVFESARDVAAGAYPSVSGGDVGKDGARQREKFFSVEAGFARARCTTGTEFP